MKIEKHDIDDPPDPPRRRIARLPDRQGRQGFGVDEPKVKYRVTKRERCFSSSVLEN
jgi:hypothetical protein